MLDRLTGLISYGTKEQNRDAFQKVGEYTIDGKKTYLWLAKNEKKFHMNLKSNRLFIYKVLGNGEIEVSLKKGKTVCAPGKKDKREVLSNLLEILKTEKRPNIKIIIRNIFNMVNGMPTD